MQTFVRDLRDEHDATILLTTHDLDEASRLADRIGILHQGRLVAEGTPAELADGTAADARGRVMTLTGGASKTRATALSTDVTSNVGAQLGLAYAFVEREIALSKRYWAWEIGGSSRDRDEPLGRLYQRSVLPPSPAESSSPRWSRLVLICRRDDPPGASSGHLRADGRDDRVGADGKARSSHVMAPVPRTTHLLGMCAATLVRALGFSVATWQR